MLLTNYTQARQLVDNRLKHMMEIFAEEDENCDWWVVESYIDFDISYHCVNHSVLVDFTPPPYIDDEQYNHQYSFPIDLFEHGNDDEIAQYAKDRVAEELNQQRFEQIRSVIYGLENEPEMIDFIVQNQDTLKKCNYEERNQLIKQWQLKFSKRGSNEHIIELP